MFGRKLVPPGLIIWTDYILIMATLAIWIGVGLVALMTVGCASLPAAPQHMTVADPGSLPSPASALGGMDASQQQGALNIADAVDIGIQYGMPLGLMPLIAGIVWLSHKREVLRLKQNGRPPCTSK